MLRKFGFLFAALVITFAAVTLPSGALAQTDCEYPNILIVLDRSGSMTSANKWNNAKQAVSQIVNSPTVGDSKVQYGLMVFAGTYKTCSNDYNKRCSKGGDCCFLFCSCNTDCSAGEVNIGVGLHTGNAIMNYLNNVSPDTYTPIGSSLVAASNYSGITNPNKRSYVLLITDGAETCGGNPVNAVKTLYNKNIKTFVVGFGSDVDPDTLNTMALEGGTRRGPQKPYYYQADNANELNSALENIMQIVTAEICDGKDQNCNGLIDEDPNDPSKKLSQACSTACGSGRQWCDNGAWGPCDAPQPQPEVCDGVDNDCDGKIDEPEDIPSLKTDINNCGACFNKCPTPANAYPTCVNGVCGFECIAGYHKENGVCVGDCQPTNGGIEICDYIDNNCNGLVDEDAQGKELGLRDACGTCDFAVEVCNGKDDNCDGQVDEGFHVGEACDTGLPGICAEGKWQCDPNDNKRAVCKQVNLPREEECNNLDDNCDGQIDEWLLDPCETICETGNRVCVAGVWQECDARKPTPEICDGRDNDCNGLIDDGELGLGVECETGLPGACMLGRLQCISGAQTCVGNVQPTEEICDGIDNDCDGVIDNNLDFVGKPCVTGQPGACAYGEWQCASGLEVCVPNSFPEEEKCDGIDNDCDGVIDNGASNACGVCGPVPQEICDGIDNNCDGRIDEETPNCRAGEQCIKGECLRSCPAGECPAGYECQRVDGKDLCVTPCFGVKCDLGWACDENTGKCRDLCEGVSCGANEKCLNGKCVDVSCLSSGCPVGERCKADGTCEADPCASVKCAATEFCRDGRCVSSCAFVSCPGDQKCVDGQCIEDKCAMKNCRKGEVCVEGKCELDPCYGVECQKGLVCEEGECIGDPCLTTVCPEGQNCREGQCVNALDPCGDGRGVDCEMWGDCIRNSDCAEGEECVSNYCEPIGTKPDAGDDDDNDDFMDDDDSQGGDDDDNDDSSFYDDDDSYDDDDFFPGGDEKDSDAGKGGAGGEAEVTSLKDAAACGCRVR